MNEVVPPGQALSAAKRWAELILECSPKAIRASKQSYFRGLEESKSGSRDAEDLSGSPGEQGESGLSSRGPKPSRKSGSPIGRTNDGVGISSFPDEHRSLGHDGELYSGSIAVALPFSLSDSFNCSY